MSNSDLYRATSAILNGEIIKPSSIQTVYAPADPAKYNAGFYNFPDFHSSNGSGDGYTTYYRISNDTRDVLVVQSNYPVKDYFKVREICNDLMENLIKNAFIEIGNNIFYLFFYDFDFLKSGCASRDAVLRFTCTVVARCIFYGSENVSFIWSE